jgi:cell division protein FtsI/penicillin-binding protein 2
MEADETVNLDFRRLTLLGLLLTFGLAIILAQLVRYQVLMHAELLERAEAQRTRIRVLKPERGYIADTNGRILAMNAILWEISASPNLVSDPDGLA